MKAVDLTGRRFGRLEALGRVVADGRPKWLCRCDCGATKFADRGSLVGGSVASCGCLRREIARVNGARSDGAVHVTHGQSKRPEYPVWKSMRARCSAGAPNEDRELYYARGIRVCDRWSDFALFFADMGPRPSSKHSIDRVDNNGNYEPDNCRWATAVEQASNRRPRRKSTKEVCA